MLLSLVPMFDDKMTVKAYSVFTQKHNLLLNPILQGTGSYDGAGTVEALEVLQVMGIETISDEHEVFVPVTNISILGDVEGQCDAPHERIVILIDNTIPPVEMYISRLKELKAAGYKLAIRNLAVSEFESYRPILSLMDYCLLNNRKIAIDKAKIYFGKLFPDIRLCAGNIDTQETYDKLVESGGYQLYEGPFYRIPVTKGAREVAPLKINYISLLNTVNNENFDLTKAADIIARDTALTISMLQMVNRMARNSEITSIRHAAAMLGQKELKKWINTAVVGALTSDKPSEVTRLSLLRARFAENLAPSFGLAGNKEELFLLGLFSVLDVILEKPMEEALKMVQVPKSVQAALTGKGGALSPVYEFIIPYETANWPEVSRQMVVRDISMEAVRDAFMDSLTWYRALTSAAV